MALVEFFVAASSGLCYRNQRAVFFLGGIMDNGFELDGGAGGITQPVIF